MLKLKDGLINDWVFFWFFLKFQYFQCFEWSNHSIIVKGRKVFMKNFCFPCVIGIFFIVFFCMTDILYEGINLLSYFGGCDFSIFQKQQTFLYQNCCWRVSESNFWYIFFPGGSSYCTGRLHYTEWFSFFVETTSWKRTIYHTTII